MLEKLLLRLNEQGLEVSSPWAVNQEQLLVEALWPRLHQACKEKERWRGCRELDAEVQENWDHAKLCLQACKSQRSAADSDCAAVKRCPGPMVATLRDQTSTLPSV